LPIATEGVEVLHAVGEGRRDLRRGHHCGEGVPVAGRLADRHDVGHQPLGREPPERGAHPTEADLHLVGDDQTAGRAHMLSGCNEIAVRQHHLSATADHRLHDHPGELSVAGLASTSLDVCRVPHPDARAVASELAAVGIRHRCHVHPRRCAPTAGTRVLVGAHVDERLGVAVIAVLDADEVPGAGAGADEAQCEVVRLAAGVDEEAHRQRLGQRGGEALGIAEHLVVEVAGVGVEHRHLPGSGRDDMRVRMADVRDVVDRVEVGATLVVVQVRADPAHDPQRVAVRDRQVGAEEPSSLGERVGDAAVLRRCGQGARKSQQQRGIRREAEPRGSL
jgi:hypothetical protein